MIPFRTAVIVFDLAGIGNEFPLHIAESRVVADVEKTRRLVTIAETRPGIPHQKGRTDHEVQTVFRSFEQQCPHTYMCDRSPAARAIGEQNLDDFR